MRLLWLYFLVTAVTAQAGFGRSYLGNSRLCHTWHCLNQHLNLTDSLPPRERYSSTLRALLPETWHGTLDAALDSCYGNRSRKYTNTCPGQALMHCTVDQMIQNCPSEKWAKADGCAPLSSVAAFSYMFSQSRYNNLEENLLVDRRPAWFLTNYFDSKCCELPQLFSDATLQQCGFSRFMLYHDHELQRATTGFTNREVPLNPPFGKAGIRKPHPSPEFQTTTSSGLQVEHFANVQNEELDPLQCCDMSSLVPPEWRARCGLELRWRGPARLSIVNSPDVTTPAAPVMKKRMDVRVTPLPCEQQDCIYRRVGVVSDIGTVDVGALSKLLDNLTDHRPEWRRAKARVLTKCLSKPVFGYDSECPINKILGCTADILSENCPNAPKSDPCKHGGEVKDGITCQISSSPYRPKNRRQFCALPNLVSADVLAACGVTSTWRREYAAAPPRTPTTKWAATSDCKPLTESTSCVLSKMGALNKYGFLDYFRLKDRLREFAREQGAGADAGAVYTAALQAAPLYRDSCGSPRKLLNVLDAVLMTCPASKRSNTEQCRKMFNEMSNLHNITEQKRADAMKQFQRVYLPPLPSLVSQKKGGKYKKVTVKTNKIYDFGIFNNEDVPQVKLIDVKPKNEPLVLLPVYQRNKFPLNQVNNDGVYRGAVNIGV